MRMCIFIQDRRMHRHHIKIDSQNIHLIRMHPSAWSLLLLNVDDFPTACTISISPLMVPCKIPYCTVYSACRTWTRGHEGTESSNFTTIPKIPQVSKMKSILDMSSIVKARNPLKDWPSARQEPVDLESPQVTPTRPGPARLLGWFDLQKQPAAHVKSTWSPCSMIFVDFPRC